MSGAHARSAAGSTAPGPWRAVVDVGSVSTGLLLTDGEQRIRRSVDTRLGAGTLAADGGIVSDAISADALQQLDSVLADYRRLAEGKQAPILAIGTAAARRPTNRADLETVVADRLGVPLRVVSSAEEAALTFTGACSHLPGDGRTSSTPADPTTTRTTTSPTGPVVTIDLGGGSTEFACTATSGAAMPEPGTAQIGGPVVSWSAPIGGVLITQAYLHGDPPRPEELSAALSVVELHLDDLRREIPPLASALADPDAVVLGVGGVVTVAAVEIGLLDVDPLNGDADGPVHGLELDRAAIEDVFRTLATETRDDRVHNPGLPASRVDDIVGGCVVLVETMRQFGIETIVVSQRGLADGALLHGDHDGTRFDPGQTAGRAIGDRSR